ncbi:MAG: D-alanyl-D-alanine carboxypeptidase, partial [Planctomycetota bacterium]
FRVLGKELGGEGSFIVAKATLRDWALQNFMKSDPLVFQDGSGLSRQNRLTSRFLLNVVDRAISQDWGADFTEQLAVGGVDGTLRKRLGQSGLKGRVFAKTGTLTGVSSLAGLLFPQDSSEPVTFAMICNRKKGSAAVARKWQDRVLQWVEGQLGGN